MSDISLLLRHCGSPLYVYDLGQIRAAYTNFAACFAYRPLDIHYAVVCNHNHHILQTLADCGAGMHANTPGDAHAALRAGIGAERIMYTGSNLSGAELDYLLEQGIALNLDSLDQLKDLLAHPRCPAEVGLRLCIDDRPGNRIGVSRPELQQALQLVQGTGTRLSGLHMYAGTNNLNGTHFLQAFERLLAAAADLPDLRYLNLGGGFGVPYQPGQRDLPLQQLGREISARMQSLSEQRQRPIHLILEPGRRLVAAAGTLYMQVISVKERPERRFVGVDSSVANIVVPSVYHPYHAIEAVTPRGPLLDIPTDICGASTHSRDFLGRDLRLPALQPGDLLALKDAGAYGYAMSSHFLNRPRPAEVVKDGTQWLLSRRRESLDDLLTLQIAEPLVL